MKLSTVYSYAVVGVKAQSIHIEVHIANGLPGLSIVGLPEASVRESKDRVRSAIQNAGFEYPARRITVNLAPADIPKFGAGYDLPIAIGILNASDQICAPDLNKYALVGELSLSGQIRAVGGILPIAVEAFKQDQQLIAPAANNELQMLDDGDYRCATNLLEVCYHLSKEKPLAYPEPVSTSTKQPTNIGCLSEVQGQPQAKRALEIAAAGGHSLLMQGPPGTGKTMLASRIPSIMPKMSASQRIEVASIYSVAQVPYSSENSPPFRAPHHTTSPAALVGGGSRPAPGEISLAHKGILFLDELPEFPHKVLEVMRQPMESGEIWVSRANAKAVFPCDFQLIAAMNPCPCGYSGESRCRCSTDKIQTYQNRISGPLLDRIDLHIRLTRSQQKVSQAKSTEETSALIRQRIISAQERQNARQQCLNSQLEAGAIQDHLNRDQALSDIAQSAMEKMQLSMRSVHRAFKVALTLSDLSQSSLNRSHLMEAFSYRQTLGNF